MEQVKQIEYDMLVTLADFCDAHGLTYYLSGGTLLGAVRHQGFIPWDDDIDVMMPREDYMTFLQTFRSKNYKIQSVLLGDRVPPYACIIDQRTTLKELDGSAAYIPSVWLDIFPLDGWGNVVWRGKAKCILKELLLYCYDGATMRFVPTKRYLDRAGKFNRIKSLFRTCVKYLFISLFHVTNGVTWGRLADRIARGQSMDSSAYSGCFITTAHHNNGFGEMLPTSALQGKAAVQFEGRDFWAPVGWEQYLTNLYGDYMKLPPKEKQVSHHDFRAYWNSGEPVPCAIRRPEQP